MVTVPFSVNFVGVAHKVQQYLPEPHPIGMRRMSFINASR
jgi:hypothetical protein